MKPVVAEQLVHLLRGVRQERREDRLQAVDGAERRRRGPLPARSGSVLTSAHGAWSRDVLVDVRGEPHRLRRAPPGTGPPRCARRPCRSRRRRRRAPPGPRRVSARRLGDGAEVPVGVRQRPVDEVAPVREQLVVVAPDELGPGEVGVLRLRALPRSGSSAAGRGRSGRGSRGRRSCGRGSSRTASPPCSGTRSRRRRPAGGAACRPPTSPPSP